MARVLELIVAAAIGAAAPTVAGLYFSKPPEVYVDGPQVSLCGTESDPCHIRIADTVKVELDCGVPGHPIACDIRVKQDSLDSLNVAISP